MVLSLKEAARTEEVECEKNLGLESMNDPMWMCSEEVGGCIVECTSEEDVLVLEEGLRTR